MKKMVWCVAATLLVAPAMAAPAPPAHQGSMERMMSCQGPSAAMEIYLPEDVLTGATPPKGTVDGMYALDLSAALKGKHLEPVHISTTPDGKSIVVDQYTRGLPPTTIPVAGGTVDFDHRFGTHAVCSKFWPQ